MSLRVEYVHTAPAIATLYFHVIRMSDGYYWDTSDSTFKTKGSIAGTNARTALPEDANETGRYIATLATVSVAQWTDGDYRIIVRNSASDTILLEQQIKYMKDQAEVFLRLNQV